MASSCGYPVKIYCKNNPNFNLAIKGGSVVLVPADPCDDSQIWYKDDKMSYKKDPEGSPFFALINKATSQAMKPSIKDKYPVQVVPYKPHDCDESIQWTQGVTDQGQGYKAIRMATNTSLNLNAIGNSIYDGTSINIWQWLPTNINMIWILTKA